MGAPVIVHGLIQKAKLDAEALKLTCLINSAGQIWRRTGCGWSLEGTLDKRQDREDFLVAQLTQEDR